MTCLVTHYSSLTRIEKQNILHAPEIFQNQNQANEELILFQTIKAPEILICIFLKNSNKEF